MRKRREGKANAATSAVKYGRSSADTGEMAERHIGAIVEMGGVASEWRFILWQVVEAGFHTDAGAVDQIESPGS